jgi:hypothetical protein
MMPILRGEDDHCQLNEEAPPQKKNEEATTDGSLHVIMKWSTITLCWEFHDCAIPTFKQACDYGQPAYSSPEYIDKGENMSVPIQTMGSLHNLILRYIHYIVYVWPASFFR